MNRNNLALIGVVAFLVIGLGLTALLLMGRGTPPAPTTVAGAPPPPRTVWVANREIGPRTVITRDMLSETSITDAGPGAITDLNQVRGKMASTTIFKGEPITRDFLTEPIKRVVPANIEIPREDLRAVAIWVDPVQTAAGLVDVGDRVDVVAAHKLKYQAAGGSGELVSGRTIAQDLEVLAVDRSINAQPVPAPGTPGAAPGAPGAAPAGGAPGAPPAPPPAPTPPPPAGQKTFSRVLVAAPPAIAERLIAANLQGELHITIRDPRTRENFPIGEAREYPVAMTDPTTQKLRDAAVQDTIEARRKRRDLEFEAAKRRMEQQFNPPQTRINMPSPTTNINVPPMPTGQLPQPAPTGHEITVVRGTEKTRVIVPR